MTMIMSRRYTSALRKLEGHSRKETKITSHECMAQDSGKQVPTSHLHNSNPPMSQRVPRSPNITAKKTCGYVQMHAPRFLSLRENKSAAMQPKKYEDHRRKWDRDEYERLAAERIQEELDAQEKAKQKQPPVKRELLRQRDYRHQREIAILKEHH
ncbi:hypothetical protein C0J52_01824 [Blattella germanica]|nr:hypothetical protein C0J52_01824 [Blattella germanica]